MQEKMKQRAALIAVCTQLKKVLENDTMEPIYTDHLMILGRVVGLQREY